MNKTHWFEISSFEKILSSKEVYGIINFESLQITRFCSTFFKSIRINKVKQIRIDLTDDFSVKEEVQKPVYAFPAFRVIMHYDFQKQFLSKNNETKKKEIVQIMREAARRTSEIMGWDKKWFEECFELLISTTNYQFIEQKNHPKKSPDKQLSACIKCDINPEYLYYFLEVKNKRGELKIIPIININVIFELLSLFGSPMFIIKDDGDWISNTEYQISNYFHNIFFRIDVEKEHCEIVYMPKDDDEREFAEAKIELATTKDEAQKTLLSKKWENALIKEVELFFKKRQEELGLPGK